MQPKTLIALGAFLAITVAAWLTMRAPEKGQRVGPPPRPIAALKASDIKELELTSNGGKDQVVLKLDGSERKLTLPGTFRADQSQVKTAVDQLERIHFADLITENQAKFADFEVSDDKGAHVVAKDGAGKILFDAWLGKSSSGFTLLRPVGKNEVWQASGLYKYTYAKDVKGWRDRTVLDFSKDDVSKLTVVAGAQRIALERLPPPEKGREAKWKVLEATVKIDPLDEATANGLLQAMSTLRAADFDDTSNPAEVGLAPPEIQVTAMVKEQPVTLNVGKQKGEDSWVSVEGRPQVFLVQKHLIERLAVRPQSFRDKTIVKATEADLTEVTISTGGETLPLKHEGAAWRSSKGELDDGKVKPLTSAFENLQAGSYADTTDPKITGLGNPSSTVILKLRDKGPVTLKIGAQRDGSDYYVQRSGAPDVYLVKKYNVDRFLKKFADLKK